MKKPRPRAGVSLSGECPLLAEAVSKRKITRAGGNYDLHFDWHVAKVGPVVLRAKDSLPMWCAVPVTSKTRLF